MTRDAEASPRRAAAALCRALDAEGLEFVVPRNFELPGSLVGDLDLWVRPGQLSRASRALLDTARAEGWRLVSRWELPWHRQYMFCRIGTNRGSPPPQLAVDLESEVGRKGYRYAPLGPFLEERTWEGPYPRPTEAARSVALALHVVLSKGAVSDRYLTHLLSCPLDAFSEFARRVLPRGAARELTRWLDEGAPGDSIPELATVLRRRLVRSRPGNQLRRAYVRARSQARYLGPRRGLLVAFVGPDGGGKTTTARLVRESLPRLPAPVSIVYMGKKEAVLPTSRLIRWISSRFGGSAVVPGPGHRDGDDRTAAADDGDASPPPEPPPSLLTRVADVLGLANWVAEQWWRYLTEIRPVLQQEGVVLTDRYFLDFVQRPDFSVAHTGAVRRLLLRLFPEPDLTVLLSADSATLLRRKPTGGGTDREATLIRMRKALSYYARTLEVSTGQGSPAATASDLAARIVEQMAAR